MAIGRDERFAALTPRLDAEFGPEVAARVLDVLALMEMAWHDCYGEVSPPPDVIDDILVFARGDLGRLVEAARLAVLDFRDLRLAADHLRSSSP